MSNEGYDSDHQGDKPKDGRFYLIASSYINLHSGSNPLTFLFFM